MKLIRSVIGRLISLAAEQAKFLIDEPNCSPIWKEKP